MLFLFTGTRARILVASAWIFSVIFSIPSLVLFEDTPSPKDESIRFCYLDLSEKWHWMVSWLLFFFLTSFNPHFSILLYMITFCFFIYDMTSSFFNFAFLLFSFLSLMFSFLSLLFFSLYLSFFICNLLCFFFLWLSFSTFPCLMAVFLYREFFLCSLPFSRGVSILSLLFPL